MGKDDNDFKLRTLVIEYLPDMNMLIVDLIRDDDGQRATLVKAQNLRHGDIISVHASCGERGTPLKWAKEGEMPEPSILLTREY